MLTREAVDIVVYALLGAALTVIVNSSAPGDGDWAYFLVFLVSMLIVPRAITYLGNWRAIGGPSYIIEIHRQGGSPNVALVSVRPTFWSRSFSVKGRSYRIEAEDEGVALRRRGNWSSREVSFRRYGVVGRVLYYFYSGHEHIGRSGNEAVGEQQEGYPVPDGMTSLNLNDDAIGSGFFFDKMDDGQRITRHPMKFVQVTGGQRRELRREGVALPRLWRDPGAAVFETFQTGFADLIADERRVKGIFGSRVADWLAEQVRYARSIELHPDPVLDLKRLHRRLVETAENADARFSGFQVAACLVTSEGREYYGANFENSAFPAGICAESGAISQMVTAAGPQTIEQVVLYSPNGGDSLWPCGLCLQRIADYAGPSARVLVLTDDGTHREKPLGELLSQAFRLEAAPAGRPGLRP